MARIEGLVKLGEGCGREFATEGAEETEGNWSMRAREVTPASSFERQNHR
jgi:hypothetical protein